MAAVAGSGVLQADEDCFNEISENASKSSDSPRPLTSSEYGGVNRSDRLLLENVCEQNEGIGYVIGTTATYVDVRLRHALFDARNADRGRGPEGVAPIALAS